MSHLPLLAIINQKGGVGKTTFASCISEYGAKFAKLRILLVDLDMQCNLTDYFVGMDQAPNEMGGQIPPKHPDVEQDSEYEQRSSILDTFYGKPILPHETFLSEENGYEGYVDIIAAHPKIEKMNNEFAKRDGTVEPKTLHRLKEIFDTPETAAVYDIVIFDCAPSRQPIFRSAMRATTHVLIPYEPEEKAMQGINAMMQSIQTENFNRKSKKEHIKLVGIVPSKVRIGTKLHKNNMEYVKSTFGDKAFPDELYLPMSTRFPERDVKGANPRSIYDVAETEAAYQRARLLSAHVFHCVLGIENEDTEMVKRIQSGESLKELYGA